MFRIKSHLKVVLVLGWFVRVLLYLAGLVSFALSFYYGLKPEPDYLAAGWLIPVAALILWMADKAEIQEVEIQPKEPRKRRVRSRYYYERVRKFLIRVVRIMSIVRLPFTEILDLSGVLELLDIKKERSELDVRFRLNPVAMWEDRPELLTFVEVENKTDLDIAAWINLDPTVAGQKLGKLYTNGHYNGQRRWQIKKWATIYNARFSIEALLNSAELTFDKARTLFNSASTPQERESVLAIAVKVEYAELLYQLGSDESDSRYVIGPKRANPPEHYHFNFNRMVWVTDVSPPEGEL